MAQNFADRILVHVAKLIKNKEKPSEKLLDNIINECFPERKGDEKLRKLVKKHLNHLLNPRDDIPFIRFLDDKCDDCQETIEHCIEACPVDAIEKDDQGKKTINYDLCIDCGYCVNACITGVIVHRSEFAQIASMLLKADKEPLFAILAPSFVGQFGDNVSPEQVKGVLKLLGFNEVFEVAVAADIITHLEAEEFHKQYAKPKPFMITSCCCPAFIKLVEKHQPNMAELVSNSVSPMIALGRILKERYSKCQVVFVGPCIAKKNEAKRPDLSDSVDCVLTFKETQALLEAAGLDSLSTIPEVNLEDASHDGRIFAYTGGVTTAIKNAVYNISPETKIHAVKGNGIKECKELLQQAEEGMLTANFMEGMACPNGCVGGPGTIIKSDKGSDFVNSHADKAVCRHSYNNKEGLKLFNEFSSVDKLLSAKHSKTIH